MMIFFFFLEGGDRKDIYRRVKGESIVVVVGRRGFGFRVVSFLVIL